LAIAHLGAIAFSSSQVKTCGYRNEAIVARERSVATFLRRLRLDKGGDRFWQSQI